MPEVACMTCMDGKGLAMRACPECGGDERTPPPADPADIARERLEDRALMARSTLAALAGLLQHYGLIDEFADTLTAIGGEIHRRHNEMAAEL